MNINQAFKQKKKIQEEIEREWERVRDWNRHELGVKIPYSANESYKRMLELKEELIDLKARIHRANTGIVHLIFRLSEWKDTLSHLKGLKCIQGVRVSSSSYGKTETMSKISILERDQWITDLELQIDDMQDDIEKYNFRTQI
jgi:hypothetical protein